MRPDVALAFDRMERGRTRRRRRAHDQQRLPLRRRAGRAVGPPPGPEDGSPRPASRCTATAPSSTSGRPPPTAGSRRTRSASTSFSDTLGTWHFGYTLNPRSSRAARRRRRRRASARGAVPGIRARALRADRCARPRSAGTSPRSCSPRSSTPSRASTRSRAPRRVRRASRSSCPATARAYRARRIRSTPSAAINAQAHLMRDLLRQFGSVPLALAAYNAGPGPVSACGCVPNIPGDPRLRRPDPRPDVRRGRADRARRQPAGGAACQVSAPARACEITPARRRPASSRSGSDRCENDRRISLKPSSPT